MPAKRRSGTRRVVAADIALPPGYTIEPIATGLTFPTGITFDGRMRPVVVESGYAYGEVFVEPRVVRIEADGSTSIIARGADDGP